LNWEKAIGIKKEDIVGKRITEVIPGIKESRPNLISIYGKVALTGKAKKFDLYFKPLRKWFAVSVYSPGKGYFVAVFHDITSSKEAEARIIHLNQLLLSVFHVSRLIFKEKDSNILIKRVCKILAESQIFRYAWVVLLDEAKRPVITAEAGLGKDFLTLVKRWKLGNLPVCGQKALRQSELVVSKESLSDCNGCPLVDKHTSDSVLTIRLEHDGKAYGLLACCTISRYGLGEEEQGLLQRIAGDIAFAVYTAEVENQRRRAVDSLVKLTRYL